jgi:hypothetical protein
VIVMRRMVWLTAGAVLGIAGYRRLDRAAKSLTGQLGSGPVRRQAVPVDRSQEPGAVAGGLRASAGLALSLAAATARWAGALRARRAVARAGLAGQGRASIAGFLGDVRDGMDEYLDAHATPGVEAAARREIGLSQI